MNEAPPANPPPAPPAGRPHGVFLCGGMRFGLPIQAVGEVVADLPVTRVPGSSPGVLGAVNLRGEIVPAATLTPWFPGAAPAAGGKALYLVVRAPQGVVALRTERFEQVVPVPDAGLAPLLADDPGAEIAPLRWDRPGGSIHCLSAEALLNVLRLRAPAAAPE